MSQKSAAQMPGVERSYTVEAPAVHFPEVKVRYLPMTNAQWEACRDTLFKASNNAHATGNVMCRTIAKHVKGWDLTGGDGQTLPIDEAAIREGVYPQVREAVFFAIYDFRCDVTEADTKGLNEYEVPLSAGPTASP